MRSLRPLGDSGLTVSPLGLGLAALGRPGYITLGHAGDVGGDTSVAAMQAHTHKLLDQAWAAGITYFDAARSYGRAEEFLGAWLRSRKFSAQPPVVGSKWGYTYTAGWQVQAAQHEVKEHSVVVLRRHWQESRALLGGFLRLYQIHSATFESGVLDRTEVLAELVRLKTQGCAIGLTLSGEEQAAVLAAAQTRRIDGVRVFDVVQATWNLLERACGPALAEARAAGMGVILKEALANGRLTARNTAPEFAPQRAQLATVAARYGVAPDAVALAAALAQPWADIVLSGAATAGQLASNLDALRVALREEEQADLAGLVEPPAVYWATRRTLPWN
jgi:aryl-alcohol dehydrogenase-like predicted oxidoreductase